jgi:hypothetical protein
MFFAMEVPPVLLQKFADDSAWSSAGAQKIYIFIMPQITAICYHHF